MIDISDIFELDVIFWVNVIIMLLCIKLNVSLCVLIEVIDFFKVVNFKGYTARMVAVFAAYVQAHQSKP